MFTVAGYELDPGRRYDPNTNLWVLDLAGGGVSVGFDPLGAETTGDIVAISLPARGVRIARGDSLATIEAAKFVGPMPAPIGGRVRAVNDDLLVAPGRVNADPLGTWVVELDEVDPAELGWLLRGEQSVAAWFAQAVERFRRQGAIAE